MYLQLTNECQMDCAHCAMDAVPIGCGRYMAPEDAIKAIDLYPPKDSAPFGIYLGGGEPTLHPQFWDIFRHTLRRGHSVGITTNGVDTQTTLELASLANEQDRVYVTLSVDQYHDKTMVSELVLRAFGGDSTPWNGACRVRRSAHPTMLLPYGRAKKIPGAHFVTNVCRCRDLFVYPDGCLARCGCPESSVVGHIRYITEIPPFGIGCCDLGRSR